MGIKVSASLMCMDLLHIASQVQILENYIDDIYFLFNKIYTDIYGKQIYFSNNVISELEYLNKVLK